MARIVHGLTELVSKMNEVYNLQNYSGHVEMRHQPLFENRIWRINDVAKFIGVSVKHVYNLTSRKKIPHYKKGKLLYFIPDEILNWIQEGNVDE